MTYLGWRRPPRKPRAPDRPSAAIGMLAAETFKDRPFGSHGAMLPVPEPAPPAPPVMGLVIEPPDWEAEAAAREPEPEPPPTAGMTALEVMKLNDDGYEPEPWQPPAPPIQPLVPVEIPPADWRREEIERARRDRKHPQLDESPKSLRSRPA